MGKLTIANLHVAIGKKEIIKDLSLTIRSGEVHAIMGPNGSGKSTLALALMGHPSYEVKSLKSKVEINEKNILDVKPNERAKLGLFLAFQNPFTIYGVPVASLLRSAYQVVKDTKFVMPKGSKTEVKEKECLTVFEFNKLLEEQASLVGLDKAFLRRSLNDGFSGGEKKKVEMLQALILSPKFVVFDEIDTGLDIDALQAVANGIRQLVDRGVGVLIITHYQRILHHIKPNFVHILIDGKIVESGGHTLAERIEKEGYKTLVQN